MEVEVVEETPYSDKLLELQDRMDKLPNIEDDLERYKELKGIEEDLHREIIQLREAKQKAEMLLLELNDLKRKIL